MFAYKLAHTIGGKTTFPHDGSRLDTSFQCVGVASHEFRTTIYYSCLSCLRSQHGNCQIAAYILPQYDSIRPSDLFEKCLRHIIHYTKDDLHIKRRTHKMKTMNLTVSDDLYFQTPRIGTFVWKRNLSFLLGHKLSTRYRWPYLRESTTLKPQFYRPVHPIIGLKVYLYIYIHTIILLTRQNKYRPSLVSGIESIVTITCKIFHIIVLEVQRLRPFKQRLVHCRTLEIYYRLRFVYRGEGGGSRHRLKDICCVSVIVSQGKTNHLIIWEGVRSIDIQIGHSQMIMIIILQKSNAE